MIFLPSTKKLKNATPLDLSRYFASGGAQRSKYGNRKVMIDGKVFDSGMEGDRYKQLKIMEQAGEIERLEEQVRFRCIVNDIKVCDYYADFRYYDRRTRAFVVEDVKGARTDVYKLKKKLVEALFGIEIVEK